MNHFPKPLSPQIGFDVAQTMLENFDRHYRIFATRLSRRRRCSSAATGTGCSGSRARADHVVRRSREGMRRGAGRRIRRGEHRRRSVAADQAALHRPAHVAPPARVRGDLLQFGVLQDPAPLVLQQRFHLRAPGDLDRVSGERRAGREADLPRVLSGTDRPRPRSSGSSRTSSSSRRSTISPRDIACVMQAIHDEFRPLRRSAEFPDPRAVVAVLPQQERRTSSAHHQRRPRAAVRGADPPRARRARADTVLLRRDQLMIIFGSHSYFLVDMACRTRRLPVHDHARQAEGGDLTSVGLQKQGKNPFYRDLLHHLSHSSDRFIIAPGIKGSRDARVHAAVVPVRVQDHQVIAPPPGKRRARRSWRSTSS